MATTSLESTPLLAPNIQATLAALRARIRAYIWAEGLALALVWLGFMFWASLAVDWFFEPPWWFRLGVLVVTLGVLGWIVYRYLISRLLVPLGDASMATVLERRFGQLDDSLLTAVLLTEQHLDPEKCNPEMLARTCREAASRIGGVRVGEVFNFGPLARGAGGAVLFIISVVLFAVLFPDALGLWAQRNLAFGSEPWPRQSRFVEIVAIRDHEEKPFTDGVLKVARGSEVTILARADTQAPRIPRSVEIRYRPEGGSRQRKLMALDGNADPAKDPFQQYSHRFEGVLAPIRFDVVDMGPSGDRLYDYALEVVDSPTLTITSIDCEYPSYTGRKPRPFRVSGVMQFLLGSKLVLHAEGNKPLERVQIDTLHGREALPPAFVDKAALTNDAREFTYTIPALDDDTTLLFTLFDADGIRSREPVRLVLAAQVDEPPQMRVRLDGIGTAVTPGARIPFTGQITDDHGLARMWAETALDQAEPVEHRLATLKKFPTEFDLERVQQLLEKLRSHEKLAPADEAYIENTIGANESKDLAVEVREMKVMPGQKMQLTACAADHYQYKNDGPNVGQSERWMLEIVTPEQLRAMLEARELVLRQRFEVIINEMTETRDLLLKVTFHAADEKAAADKKGDEPEDTKKKADGGTGADPGDAPREAEKEMTAEKHLALQSMRVQRALQNARKNKNEVKGVAESFDDIRKQLVNNRIDTEELKERIEIGIARPLHRIADDLFPTLEDRIERLHELLSNVDSGPAARARAQKQADEILNLMLTVRAKMIELEDYNELVEILRKVIELQNKLDEVTKERHKQKIRELMEDK